MVKPSWPRPEVGEPEHGSLRAAEMASLSNAICAAFNQGLSDEDVLDVVLCEVHAWQEQQHG